MKKAKIFFYSIITSFFLGVIIYFSIPIDFPTINIAGSSAVSPLATILANNYVLSDVVVQSGGSGLGIDVALTGKKDIGMSSKNPNSDVNLNDPQSPPFPNRWIEREMKTITIAWDGMGIVYKPPLNNQTYQLDVNIDTLPFIYLAFAGFQDVKWNQVGCKDSNNLIIPYARDGGSKKSGTAEAFFKTSSIPWDTVEHIKPYINEIVNALDNGNYGKNTIKTAESNSQTWSFFKSENNYGSMVYLSTGFILENKDLIENSGFKIATYNNGIELTQDNITKTYNWYRPLNLMVSLQNVKETTKDFIEWILTNPIDNNKLSIISSGGYIPLTEIQINTMKEKENLWVPDEKLGFSGAK